MKEHAKALMGILAILVILGMSALMTSRVTEMQLLETGAVDIGKAIIASAVAVAAGIIIFIKRNHFNLHKEETDIVETNEA